MTLGHSIEHFARGLIRPNGHRNPTCSVRRTVDLEYNAVISHNRNALLGTQKEDDAFGLYGLTVDTEEGSIPSHER